MLRRNTGVIRKLSVAMSRVWVKSLLWSRPHCNVQAQAAKLVTFLTLETPLTTPLSPDYEIMMCQGGLPVVWAFWGCVFVFGRLSGKSKSLSRSACDDRFLWSRLFLFLIFSSTYRGNHFQVIDINGKLVYSALHVNHFKHDISCVRATGWLSTVPWTIYEASSLP